MILRTLTCALLWFCCFPLLAEDIFSNLSGSTLRQKLREQYTPTTTLSYLQARQVMFASIDNHGGKVECVYTGEKLITQSIPNNSDMNTEHTWPQSQFGSGGRSRQMKTDLHHLYVTVSEVNSARGNKPFADIPDAQTESWWLSEDPDNSIPTSAIDSYSESDDNSFEPREVHKGNVARSLFYFYCIYEGNGIRVNWFTPQIQTLLEWHAQDPVDDAEKLRTLAIKNAQGNANPFVLDPTLASRALNQTPPPVGPQSVASRRLRGVDAPDSADQLLAENERLRRIIIRLELELDRAINGE